MTIEKTLNSIGNRLSRANPLTELIHNFWTVSEELEENFHSFYQQLLSYSQQQKHQLIDQ
jgi:acyl carrier protein phosphodiesterase